MTYLNTFFSNITFINSLITPIWILCLVGIMTHMIIFSIKYLKDFSLENVYPSWTVLFIGIAIAGLTAPVSGYFFIGQLTVIYGFVATCIVLPIVFSPSISIADVNQTEHIDNLCTIFFSRCSICYSLS